MIKKYQVRVTASDGLEYIEYIHGTEEDAENHFHKMAHELVDGGYMEVDEDDVDDIELNVRYENA